MASETKPIEIEDYYDKVHQVAWPRRTAGLVGGAMVGVVLGGVIGAAAALLPFIFGALGLFGAASVSFSAALASVPGTAAIFAGVLGLMGSAAMGSVGSDAGAVAGGLLEKEKREKGMQNGKSFEIKVTEAPAEPIPQMFSWKVAAVTIPLTAAFGALIALHPATASTISLMGFQGATLTAGASSAAIAASACVFGMIGSLFGLKMSYITNKASNFAFKILTGKPVFTSPEKSVAPAPEQAVAAQPEEIILSESRQRGNFASEKLRVSLQSMIEKTENRGTRQDIGLS